MGRRGQRRAGEAVSDRVARIRTSDATWSAFKRAAGDEPLSSVLGGLVEAEIRRDRAQRNREGDVSAREIFDAVNRAEDLRDEVARLTARLEFLRRQAGR